ncbi:predicted protein [Sclerotinia sclerotiorum 1980 UF-70]|uniref:Uncharacterized protein n=1 Tax=Sclerotinia sclerotiorum (strain ATCC 18683 / 1980 / Ss-1) TaxID=665079 RepID=A7EPR2_SCLS1|nr:predicted protein [Sclerotinia sclerotiorum 1980 UF-70]EDO04828.1 predicted protein [Sclerotinia sclerotiorum 1980 UF-70]
MSSPYRMQVGEAACVKSSRKIYNMEPIIVAQDQEEIKRGNLHVNEKHPLEMGIEI